MNRPRGLCWPCYYTPGVKDLYPSTSKWARRGVPENKSQRHRLPAEPTAAGPGTLEKIREMRRRAVRGESVFHPADNEEMPGSRPGPFDGLPMYDGLDDSWMGREAA